MRKVLLAVLLVIMVGALAAAQVTQGAPTTTGAPGSVAPLVDVLGAHNNYGRGCAGCHAPHSGAYGAGGNGVNGTVTDAYTGENALFAQDMGPLWNQTLDFSDVTNTGSRKNYLLVTPTSGNYTAMTAQQYADVRGAIMCLACHDGALAKGAMMQNWAYEQQIGALPSSYGTGHIPTLLGNDGTAAGTYNNDHPIGESASMDKVLGSYYSDGTNGITYTVSGGAITGITVAGQYQSFVNSYGAPALFKGKYAYPTPVNASNVPYIVCTTCHDQHVMNVYAATTNSPIAGSSTGTYAKYFFVNGPYDVNNVSVPPTQAASTTQFCRQCHFGESNEANGGSLPTAF
jgi:cytochrome c553